MIVLDVCTCLIESRLYVYDETKQFIYNIQYNEFVNSHIQQSPNNYRALTPTEP